MSRLLEVYVLLTICTYCVFTLYGRYVFWIATSKFAECNNVTLQNTGSHVHPLTVYCVHLCLIAAQKRISAVFFTVLLLALIYNVCRCNISKGPHDELSYLP